MPFFLSDDDVRRLITMEDAVAALEDAHLQLARGEAATAERVVLKFSTGWMRVLPAVLEGWGVAGYKEFHQIVTPERPKEVATVRYAVHLFDSRSGEPLAVVDADYITQVRTGATAALAAARMTPAGVNRFAVIGTGMEARSQLLAMRAVRDLRQVRVYSRNEERRARFAAEMSELLGVEVVPALTPQAALEEAQVVIVATNTGVGGGVALEGEWLRPGMHVSSIGSTSPGQREIAPSVWAQADQIVVDTRRALHESGDCVEAIKTGALAAARVQELQEVLGLAPPSRTASTLFKSVGSGLQDLAVAYRVYRLALAQGAGRPFEPFQKVKLTAPN
jgi:alanine dehydrogenase